MVDVRKDSLTVGQIYHVFNKSIAGFKILNNDSELLRMMTTIRYYQIQKTTIKLSKFVKSSRVKGNHLDKIITLSNKDRLVEIIAYCLMPTHLHLILKQVKDKGISIFMSNIQNSYARYFNTKLDRTGPLWVGKFKNIMVKTDDELLHLTRYIHLNPVTAYLVNKPEEWRSSSYQEYIWQDSADNRLCKYDDVLDIKPSSYREFVEDRISYQREVAKIKELILE